VTALYPWTPILSCGGGEINIGRRVGKLAITWSLDGGGTVEGIESGETPDKGFGLIGNQVPVNSVCAGMSPDAESWTVIQTKD